MKKTIIALMALAGVAMAIDPAVTVVVTSSGTHSSNGNATMLQGMDAAGNRIGKDNLFWSHAGATFNKEEQSFTTNGSCVVQYIDKQSGLSGANDLTLDSLSLSFDASFSLNFADDGSQTMTTLTSVGLDNNAAVYLVGVENNEWVIKSANGTNALTLSNQYTIGEDVTSVSGSYIVSSSVTENAGQYTYTINVIDSESNSLLVSGSHTGVSQNGVTNGYFANTNVMLGFGGHFGDNNSAHAIGEYSNVKIYNAVIPEPATATLSLLALCGLAARRRRK